MTEQEWDSKLCIDTCGREDYQEDKVHFPYEPTPYCVLERLADSGYIGKDDCLVDYGCGKGRVPVFLSSVIGCKSIGIEYDEKLVAAARLNIEASHLSNVCILQEDAETYQPGRDVNHCFFFNPFAGKILEAVLKRIFDSYCDNPRRIQLLFYYPHDEHVASLMTSPWLIFTDEIDCSDLFRGNNARERILIFEILEEWSS